MHLANFAIFIISNIHLFSFPPPPGGWVGGGGGGGDGDDDRWGGVLLRVVIIAGPSGVLRGVWRTVIAAPMIIG